MIWLLHRAKQNSVMEANLSSKPAKQPTLTESIARSAKYSPDSAQTKELNCAVTYYLAKRFYAYKYHGRSGLKHLLLKLSPRYQISLRRHITDYEIPQLYLHIKDNFVAEPLKEVSFLQLPQVYLWSSDSGILT